MLITKEVEVKWNANNKKHFIKKGYEFTKINDVFICKVEDLSTYSRQLVNYTCDYCGKNMEAKYNAYYKGHYNNVIQNDCCYGCKPLKTKECNLVKYGVTCTFQLDEVKETSRQTCIERYGYDNVGKVPEFIEKMKQTCLEKYGYTNFNQNKELKAKLIQGNGFISTSKQQQYLHNLLGGELNYNDSTTSSFVLDIAFPDKKIYIEYDGGFHNGKVQLGLMSEKDFNKRELDRYHLLKRNGWRMIKIDSPRDLLPSDEVLINEINNAFEWMKINKKGHYHYFINIGKLVNDDKYGKLRRIKKEDL